jgi:nucleoside-diphosphate-sugar epimerase
MRIGIVCYAHTGGSGIVATELAIALAERGHDLHVLSTEPPFRFPDNRVNLRFHEVATPAYPLFREPQYALSLATAIVQVSRVSRAANHGVASDGSRAVGDDDPPRDRHHAGRQ